MPHIWLLESPHQTILPRKWWLIRLIRTVLSLCHLRHTDVAHSGRPSLGPIPSRSMSSHKTNMSLARNRSLRQSHQRMTGSVA